MSPSTVFMITAAATLAGTIYVLWLLPDALLRWVLWLLTRTLYRVRVLGRENIPEKGGALFVCNHVSFVDALLLIASTDRRVRFMMFSGIYELPYVKPFARILGDRKSTRLNSSHGSISYAVFCLKKKKHKTNNYYLHKIKNITNK